MAFYDDDDDGDEDDDDDQQQNIAMIYNLWWSESAPEVQHSPLFIVIFAIGIFIISCQDRDDDGWSSWQEMINIINLSRSW